MTCDKCNTKFNYCFYVDKDLWLKVARDTKGHICAHCVLESLGGLDWYIVHNEPIERVRRNVEETQ